jgi:putative peptidoglycan lipid II flippase
VREERGEKAALAMANNSFGVCLVINVVLMVVLLLAAPLVLRLTAFDAEQMPLALTAVYIGLLQLPIFAFLHFFSGYLTARKSFLGPSIAPIAMKIVFIAVCLVAGTQSGVVGLSLASLLGFVAQCLALLFWLPKEKYRFQFSMRFNTPEIRRDVVILMPALATALLFELHVWVDTIIATHLGEGNAAAVSFASRLPGFVQTLVIIPIAGMVYAYMSEYAAKNDIQKMIDILWKTVRTILFVVVPIVVIAMPSSSDIVRIIYQRGEFTPEATALTGSALVWYMPGLLGHAVYAFVARLYHSLQDTRTPMLCWLVAAPINIALSISLSRVMGIGGIALASSIGISIATLLLLALLRRKMGPLGFGQTAVDIAKMAVAAIPCAAAALGAGYMLAGQNVLIRFGGSTIAGGLAYLIAVYILKEMVLREFADFACGRVRAIIHRRKG